MVDQDPRFLLGVPWHDVAFAVFLVTVVLAIWVVVLYRRRLAPLLVSVGALGVVAWSFRNFAQPVVVNGIECARAASASHGPGHPIGALPDLTTCYGASVARLVFSLVPVVALALVLSAAVTTHFLQARQLQGQQEAPQPTEQPSRLHRPGGAFAALS